MGYQGKLEFVGRTDKGAVRPNNEDAILTDLELGLVVVADGMGGYKAGEIASGMAIEIIQKFIASGLKAARKRLGASDSGYSHESVLLRNALQRANEVIHDTAKSQPQCEGMGTTVAAALFYNNRLSIAHVGDSRIYRLRHGVFEQITHDHSLLQELVVRGFYTPEEARKSLNKNLVTRALGIEPTVMVDLQEDVARVGDIYLFCSDGLNDMVPDPDIHLTMDTFSDNLEIAAHQLIKLANDNGGRDNISVVLAKPVMPFEDGNKGFFERVTDWFS
ncbi:MAG: Stp1/IreP family PP2C-type Ser/Thr phosphatase [Gammaproteobacteria bacterium]|nr:Stp1/IreP family PP2C-type Ser/Thr phosphatase [Gammaproteobacteria bacterium]MBU6509640.1 Stp1/IreP family PP2C-type Ser/Thr phosphatase [Gammaproteobacteria bacterium]MDE1984054.1 Stp1/IreP family PP2C-type Ser/Thr phosphatase [Gammaproteobacteria bacterium]MDE2108239.1 Stp1/IreP family PP2C-type Ser/Thr phosphatase [Gammaproteobacteria bacterium]MDE2461422.1 Stp1/IreP family PP2C-type Ser/Thr phosphatase [Gammaproteobacteria bacterium]